MTYKKALIISPTTVKLREVNKRDKAAAMTKCMQPHRAATRLVESGLTRTRKAFVEAWEKANTMWTVRV